jgi:hypothetical protein
MGVFSRLALGLVFIFALSANAEYRVFRLVITDATNPQDIKKREILSTLDPFQWVGYNTLKSSESIDYTDTWRCFDDTSDDEDFCPSPRAKTEVPERIPAGQPPTP